VDYDAHGLFGALQAPARRGADTAGSGAFDPNAPGEPGDYPLPPRGGPAFRASSEDRPIPVADLLPLRESSLVLVPTLSTISQPSAIIHVPLPAAPIVGAFSGESAVTAVPASKVILVMSANGDSQPARAAHNYAVALNTFLDLNASPNVPQKTGVQGSGTNLNAVDPRSPSPALVARAEGLLSEAHVQTLETQSAEEQQGPGSLSPSSKAGELLTAVPSESRSESEDEPAVGDERVETRGGGDWTNLVNVLFVVSIPMMWTYWVSHRMWSRRLTQGNLSAGNGLQLSQTPSP
jgi:hypothetical protein